MLPGARHAFRTGVYLQTNDTAPDLLVSDFSFVLVLRPRSGLAVKHGLDVLAGEIDMDYREEIKAVLINHGYESVLIEPGQRIVQARWTLTAKSRGVETKDQLRYSGFGSTGG